MYGVGAAFAFVPLLPLMQAWGFLSSRLAFNLPPPPCVCMKVIENKHSTDVEFPPPPPPP